MAVIVLSEKEKLETSKERKRRLYRKTKNKTYRVENLRRYYRITAGYKAGGCVICGYSKCDKALCFHHVNPHGKKKAIAKLHNSATMTLIKEIEKCIVVCANCHAEIHDRLKREDSGN